MGGKGFFKSRQKILIILINYERNNLSLGKKS